MENFIVSARKYRPDNFDTVVGQESITRTLKNAIKNNHLAHAYLFCGPRGVGKTTCARIFAKTINCKNITANIEPCNECDSCKNFNDNRSYNIHELDAASNNSVDDIRSLIEQVRIPPQVGTHSIYIIDEVHMLSQQAFNAFLKTLEEPPRHAIFILATTEKHKIIPTILSRCQIFDFNRIQIADMVKYLEKIASNEKIETEKDALNIIAQKADGGMRDALSIFDQIVSFSGNKITYKDVIENLNVLDYEYYFNIVDQFLNNNIAEALMIFDDILFNGFDSRNFITGLSGHFRDLLVVRDKVTLKLLEVGDSIKERYAAQSQLCTVDFLIKALDILSKTDIYYNTSRNKRLHVELALMQLCNITNEKKKSEPLTSTENQSVQQQSTPPVKEIPKTPENKQENTVSQVHVNREVKRVQPPSNEFLTTISIKDALSGLDQKNVPPKNEEIKEEVSTQQVVTGEPDKDFTAEDFEKAWLAYAETIKNTESRLYHTLVSRKPVHAGGNQYTFLVENPLQEEALLKKRSDLLFFVSRLLKNKSIQVSFVVSKEGEIDSPKFYSDEQKYSHLVKKNPNLAKLRNDLNLDFD